MPGTTLDLADGRAVGGVNLASAADTVTITIKDASGTVVHTSELGKQDAGIVSFAWNGDADSGVTAKAGKYTFTASAKLAKSTVVADTLSFGQVASVTPGSSGGSVYVNGVGNVALGQLKQIY